MKVLLLVVVLLSYSFPVFSQTSQPINANNHSTIITENKGTITIIRQTGITLEEHQKAIELEKREAEKRLKQMHTNKHKTDKTKITELRNRVKILEETLRSIERDKEILAVSLNKYQEKFGSLVSIKTRENQLEKQQPTDRDIIAIEMSEQSKNAVLAEILSNKDDKRMMDIIQILLPDTDSIENTEKEYWKKILPSVKFEHRFKFLDILAAERQRLAAIEKTYDIDVKRLLEKHSEEWERIRSSNKGS